MKTLRSISLAAFLVSGSFASAHSDPFGEIRPFLFMVGDQLELSFTLNGRHPDGVSHHWRRFDGELNVTVEEEFTDTDDGKRSHSVLNDTKTAAFSAGTWFIIEPFSEHRPSLTAYRSTGTIDILQPQWPRSVGLCSDFEVTDEHIVVVCNEHGTPESDPFGAVEKDGMLQLYGFDLRTLKSLEIASLGVPAMVYLFPRCSTLLVRDGVAYIGWARQKPKKAGVWNHEMVVSAWSIATNELNHHVVDDDVSWNTDISICEFNERIVIAYQDQAKDHGDARIELRAIHKHRKDEQGGALQPATVPDSKSEGKEKPKPESEGRSQ